MESARSEGPGASPGRPVREAETPDLSALEARIRGILRTPDVEQEGCRPVSTGWAGVDDALGGGLARGALHEWSGVADGRDLGRGSSNPWAPPLYLAIHLAWQAIEAIHGAGTGGERASAFWIGREVWPYPRALVRDFGVRVSDEADVPAASAHALHSSQLELVQWQQPSPIEPTHLIEHSLLVDARSPEKRLWAIDAALRCPSVAVVVADGSGFDMAATRRLQLAAEAGGGLGLLFRPPREARALSAATTRWRVTRPLPVTGAARPRWSLELWRSKGLSVFGSTLIR